MEKSIVLLGMMGSGKTTVGKILSRLLNIPFIDTDELIEKRERKKISEIFEIDGETYFRYIESQVLKEVLNGETAIISTGGGIVLKEENRRLIKEKGIPLFLYAPIDVLSERIRNASNRPLLKGDDPLTIRLSRIWKKRKSLYEEFENKIDTKDLSPEDVAIEIIYKFLSGDDLYFIDDKTVIGINSVKMLYGYLNKNFRPPMLLITSSPLWNKWERYINWVLKDYRWELYLLPDREAAKTMEEVKKIWEKMFSLGFTRKNPVLVLGGGTVGDTGGFAAATFLRGVPLVQIPTTLLAMLDSSIGGKRGVNYKHLKNMIGTFYDAALTIIDPVMLSTLPEHEIRNGLSEAIKSAIIGDPELFEFIDKNINTLLSGNLHTLRHIIEKTVRVKLEVVSKDPYELNGYRKVLNLGHTLAHALEGVKDFSVSHGEAVAIGMIFASFLGEKEGITPYDVKRKIEGIIKKTGLPTTFPQNLVDKLVNRMYYDKKREDEKLFWVIPEDIGRVGFYKFPLNRIRKLLDSFVEESS